MRNAGYLAEESDDKSECTMNADEIEDESSGILPVRSEKLLGMDRG
jgi:hypothetical protein